LQRGRASWGAGNELTRMNEKVFRFGVVVVVKCPDLDLNGNIYRGMMFWEQGRCQS